MRLPKLVGWNVIDVYRKLQFFLLLLSNNMIPIPLQSRAYLEPWGHDGRSPFKGSEVWKSSQLHPSSHQRSPISSKLELPPSKTGACSHFEAGQQQTALKLVKSKLAHCWRRSAQAEKQEWQLWRAALQRRSVAPPHLLSQVLKTKSRERLWKRGAPTGNVAPPHLFFIPSAQNGRKHSMPNNFSLHIHIKSAGNSIRFKEQNFSASQRSRKTSI